MAQEVFQVAFHRLHPGQGFEHDMGRQSVFGRTDGPNVDVVNGLHARNSGHLPFDPGYVDLPGNPVEREAQAVCASATRPIATITAATTSPTTGSTIVHPVHEITSPETSTPTDTSASAAMCR